MGAVPWCRAGFPLEMSPAHRGTAPEGLDLNYGWNFLLILYPEEYQIPHGDGWEDVGREESLERWICWEGSTRTTGKSRCFGVGFLFPQQQLWAGGRRRNQDSREQPKSNPPCPFPQPDPGADRFCFGLGGCSTTSGKAEAESEEVFIQIFFCTTHGALKILNLMWFVGMWK